MESIWNVSCPLTGREPLEKNIQVEVAVIGGGMAGLLTAYLLAERGVDTVVLEAERIGSGQTSRTTAKITSQHGSIYARLIAEFGFEKAQQYARANQTAVLEYQRIIAQDHIACEFEEKKAYLYATCASSALQQEAEAALSLGLPATFTTDVSLPFPIKGAVCFSCQAQFHPLRFLQAVQGKLTVYEHTRVTSVRQTSLQANGYTVQAHYIVFATHFPFINMPGYYFARMHQERSYVLALANTSQVDGMYLGIDDPSYSFRNTGDLLLLGGENHRVGENTAGGHYHALRTSALQWYPTAQEIAHWSAEDCITLDGVPYIGRYAQRMQTWYVATGFMKWGMTTSMVAAMLIADDLCGKSNVHADIFSPHRFSMGSMPPLLRDGAQAIKGLTSAAFAISQTTLDALPNGQGGVVEVDGKKVGVYKQEDGQPFVVQIRCPHLGCQLTWNPEEKSWDCPCHGSRFSYRGVLLDGPAQDGIE